jgi:hypothetical protein
MPNTTVTMIFQGLFAEQGNYVVKLNNRIARIRVAMQRNDETRIAFMTGLTYVGKPAQEPFYEGIIGASKVIVEFEEDLNKIYSIYTTVEIVRKIREDCVMFLNRIVEVVKFKTRKYWMRPLSQSDIIYFNLSQVSDKYNMKKPAILMRSMDPLTEEIKPIEQSAVNNDISNILETDATVPVHEILLLDAFNYYSIGQYNHSIILANIALEEYVRYFLFNQLTNKLGSNLDEANLKISEVFALKKKQGKSGFHKVMSTDFKEITGRSLEENQELWNKFNSLRTIRKNIIHPFIKRATSSETYNSLKIVLDIFHWTEYN